MTLGKIVAKNIKSLREAAGLSQQKLSEKTKLTVRYISRLENTAPNVTLEVLERLAQGLGCSPEDIVAGSKMKGGKALTKSVDEAINTLKRIKTMIEE